MIKIGLIGFGNLGFQIKNMIDDYYDNKAKFVIFDDNLEKRKNKYFFNFNDYTNYSEDIYFIVCLGYKHLILKKEIILSLKKNNRKLFSFIHPTSFINKKAKIGDGVIIYPFCNIDINCHLHDGVLLNNSVTISHDSIVGNSSFLAPGVILSGNVNVGECTFLGTNTSIANNIKIGNNCTIGIGSVITSNIENNISAIGNPIRIKKIRIQ